MQARIRIAATAALLALLCVPVAAFAHDIAGALPAAPFGLFSTFSAYTPETGRSAVAFSAEKSGSPDYYRYSSEMAFGITDDMEMNLTIPYTDDDYSAGFEDVTLGIKHRFYDERGYGPALAYMVTLSAASSENRFSTDGAAGAGFIASKRIGPFKGHVNVFYTIPFRSGLNDELRASAGVVFSADHNFKILAEVIARTGYDTSDISYAEARLGYRFLYGKNTYSTMGIGFGFKDNEPDYRVLLQLSLTFPYDEPIVEEANGGEK